MFTGDGQYRFRLMIKTNKNITKLIEHEWQVFNTLPSDVKKFLVVYHALQLYSMSETELYYEPML